MLHFDHASAAPLAEEVRAAMEPFLGGEFGSPHSVHGAGVAPAQAIERAEAAVAELVGMPSGEVVFTSGATEARNLAVKGLAAGNSRLGRHVVATALEHPAVLAACRTLARDGGELTLVGVDREGRIDPHELAAAVTDQTCVVCIHHGQHEIGAVQDVSALVAAVRARRAEVRIHLDLGATAGLLPVAAERWDADAVSVGGWPVGAPPWSGALVIRPGARLYPQIEGGIQHHGKRSGAENLPAIAALGRAAELWQAHGADRTATIAARSEQLVAGLLRIADVRLTGPRQGRVPGLVSVLAGWVEGESLALALAARGLAVAPGSSCTAHGGKAAPTLEAIGLEPPWTHSAVLLSLGPSTSAADVEQARDLVEQEVRRLRQMSPLTP